MGAPTYFIYPHGCSASRPGCLSLRILKNLSLTFSRLSEESIKALLDSGSSLRSFTYEAGIRAYDGHHDPWDGTDHFRLIHAVDHLKRHGETLESLHLDLRRRGNWPDVSDPYSRALVSFRQFRVLKHLFLNLDEFHTMFWEGSIEGDCQLLVDLLLPSLESLHLAGRIVDDLPRLEKSLLGLMAASLEGEFLKLREVRWSGFEEVRQARAIRTAFASKGVDFDYGYWPVTESTLGDDGQTPLANCMDPMLDLEDFDI